MSNLIRCIVPDVTRNFTILDGKTNLITVDVFETNDLILRFKVVNDAGAAVDISGWVTMAYGVYPEGSTVADFTGTPTLEGGGTGGYFLVTMTDVQLTDTPHPARLEVQVANLAVTTKRTIVRGRLNVTATHVV